MAGCGLILVTWAFAVRYSIFWTPVPRLMVVCRLGHLEYIEPPPGVGLVPPRAFRWTNGWSFRPDYWKQSRGLPLRKRLGLVRPILNDDQAFFKYRHYRLPLWVIMALAIIPTAWLWYRDRRLPGHCRRWAYDLTGNVSGICPECGAPT